MLILAFVACLGQLSATCTSDRSCGEGACVNSVCQGVVCEVDGDCPTAQECASIQGSKSCARSCDADGDCYGESTCVDVPESSASDALVASYCF